MTDDEIAGMLIGLLMAGQHTSSTTSSWLGFYLSREKPLQVCHNSPRVNRCQKCLFEQNIIVEEQKRICGEPYTELTYEHLRDMSLLDRCLKETLRLRPPIMVMMRMVKTDQVCLQYAPTAVDCVWIAFPLKICRWSKITSYLQATKFVCRHQ